MMWLPKALLATLGGLLAPVVCLFYRRGWFVTPDDPVSPFGRTEPTMVWIYGRFGKFVGDWWWCGVRNRAYGLTHALKPAHFKRMTSYAELRPVVTWRGRMRVIEIDGYREYMIAFRWFHVIAGYRLRPIRDAVYTPAPYRAVNMDARPILSIRAGERDD